MEETSGEESWALVPYPGDRVDRRVAADAANASVTVYGNRRIDNIQDVIKFGANVFSEAYRRAANDMFEYMNNGFAVTLQKNEQALNYMISIQEEINRRTNYQFEGLGMTLANGVQTSIGEVTKAVRNISTADQAIINSLYQENMTRAERQINDLTAQLNAANNRIDQLTGMLIREKDNTIGTISAYHDKSTSVANAWAQQSFTNVNAATQQTIGILTSTRDLAMQAGKSQGLYEATKESLDSERATIKNLNEMISDLRTQIETVRREKDARIVEVESQLKAKEDEYSNLMHKVEQFANLEELQEESKKKIAKLESERDELIEKAKKSETVEVSDGGQTVNVSVDRYSYVPIAKEILEKPVKVEMNREFFFNHKYLGFVFEGSSGPITGAYNKDNKLELRRRDGSEAFMDTPDSLIATSQLVIFKNSISK